MNDVEFRAMLDLFMCCDPWPVPDDCDGEENHKTITEMLNRKARQRGYEGWVDAYHEFKLEPWEPPGTCLKGHTLFKMLLACRDDFEPNVPSDQLPRSASCNEHCVHFKPNE